MIKCVLYSFILLFNSRSTGRIIQQLTQETIHPVVKTRSTDLPSYIFEDTFGNQLTDTKRQQTNAPPSF